MDDARRDAHPRATRAAQRLLRVAAGQHVTELERLRIAPVQPTINGLIAALERLRELRILADGLAGLDALPHARLRVLMVAAERQRGGELADLRESRRLATLMAFAITAAERGQDDALEHFDRLHGDLLLRAAAAGKRERLRDGTAIDDAGRTLAAACSVLLDDTIAGSLRDAVFAAVERERLAAAVTAIKRLTRSPDDRARELVTRSYAGVRRYLPLLLDTIAFHATSSRGRSQTVGRAPLRGGGGSAPTSRCANMRSCRSRGDLRSGLRPRSGAAISPWR
ncbi:MAG: hypothetical protein LC777_04995 [Actinobacteria bacterium]|nr:hypothetical protein [Actinomycetota bacterium]